MRQQAQPNTQSGATPQTPVLPSHQSDRPLELTCLCQRALVKSRKARPKRNTGIFPQPQTGAPQAALNLLASWMSFCWMVTRLAWIAQRFASWKRFTKKASVASCNANRACDCHLFGPSSPDTPCAISLTCVLISQALLITDTSFLYAFPPCPVFARSPSSTHAQFSKLNHSPISEMAASKATNPSSSDTSGSPSAQQCRACISSCAAAQDPAHLVFSRSLCAHRLMRVNRRAKGALYSFGRATLLLGIWAALRILVWFDGGR